MEPPRNRPFETGRRSGQSQATVGAYKPALQRPVKAGVQNGENLVENRCRRLFDELGLPVREIDGLDLLHHDATGQGRPVRTLWYPSAGGGRTMFHGENGVFHGTEVLGRRPSRREANSPAENLALDRGFVCSHSSATHEEAAR